MRKVFIFLFFCLTLSCAKNNSVYWCGDHPCINKKEKEDYFKKTMVVEKRIITDDNKKKLLQSDKIIKQVKINQKKQIQNDKEIAKQAKLEKKLKAKEEKERIKREKKIAKKIKKEEKKRLKQLEKPIKEKKISKNEINILKDDDTKKIDSDSVFADLMKKIINKNIKKPYPSINDIPN